LNSFPESGALAMRSVNSNISNKPVLLDRKKAAETTSGIKTARFGSQLLAIEQRMLFDGALALSVDATTGDTSYADKTSVVDKSFDRAAILSGAAAKASANSAPRDLVVIDTSIANWQTVADAANPSSQLLLLNAEQDGLSQIANAMVSGNYKSVHIVSHGDDGKLRLGNRSVTAANIEQYSADLERIGQSLTESGDIILYGCEIGKGAAGASFLQALARATNADVAASTNNTGAAAKGGDWVLEAQTGSIETLSALSTANLGAYAGLLPVTAADVALTIVASSDVQTDPSSDALSNDPNPERAVTVSVAPGEIVRYRMIVRLPEGDTTGASINATLPTGLQFMADGSATIAFIADGGIVSTTVSGGAVVGSGASLGDPAIASIRPVAPIGASQITVTGTSVTFNLGNLFNYDNDVGGEFVVIEFNAMVDNASSTVARGQQKAVSFEFSEELLPGVRSSITSDVDSLKIIEPQIVNVDKRFVSLVGNVATFETTFSNTGDSNADRVRVVDTFAGYPNITFGPTNTVTVTRTDTSGTSLVTYTNNGASGFDFVISTVKPGDVITVRYTANVTDITQAVPSQDIKVTYTSLTLSPSDLSSFGGALDLDPLVLGVMPSLSLGERTGELSGYGAPMNTYSSLNGAGIGIISGRLWDDTPAYGGGLPSDSFTTGERALEGITVNLRDVATTLIIRSTQTLANGTYSFTGLAVGDYRVEVATPTFNDSGVGGSGMVKIRYDAGGGTPLQQSDGVISLALVDGSALVNQDFGFVQLNEAPVVSKPGDKTIAVNSVLSFDNGSGATSAGFIAVADEIQNIATANMVMLTVTNGTLDFPTTYTPPAGFTVLGRGTPSLSITGAINSLTAGAPTINTILAQLQYRPTTGYVGNDQLIVRIDDKGALGDADGDCNPNEVDDDNLFDSKTINITIAAAANNPPVAVDDARSVQANQTITNGQAINGNGLGDSMDTDPDIADAGRLTICGVVAGNTTTVANAGVGSSITGTWGNLVLQSNGSYTYTPNAAALALPAGATRVDQFSYCLQDPAGSKDVGLITINLTGTNVVVANNPPVAVDDARSVQANQTITNGQAINGNGLGDSMDTDPDVADAGLLTICGVVAGNTTTVANTGVGTSIAGTWGNLVLQSNGSYTYTPNAAALALPAGATRVDQFSYCLQDPASSKDVGLITINLTGTNVVTVSNPPVAVDDARTVQGNQTITNGQAINGNGVGDSKDTDPDVADAGLLTICGVEAGNKTAVGTSGVGTAIVGTYGTLVLQSNGSYTYTPNAAGQALQVGTTRVDQFSYCLQDPAGNKDVGLITINLTGVKNPPAGADKFIPLTEDIPYKITPSDFGFTDMDGDAFKAVRITELPNPAGGKLFFNGQEVVFTAANPFLTVPFADIGKLEFRPAPDVNTATLSAPPSISFQVCDSDGVLDPTPNKLTFSIAPANDPPKASQSVYEMDSSSPSCALEGLVLAAGTKPGVSDPDVPADTLTVAITAVPPVTEGQYFIGNSTVPLKAGDTLTPAQLQQLCFKPNPAISGTPNSTGRIPTTPLTYTVSDGKGGQDTSGSIQVNVRPPPVISVPPLPPVVPVPPVVVPPVVPPALPPFLSPPVGRTVSTASALRAADDLRFSPIEDAKDLDAGGFFDGASIKSVWNRERVAGVQVVAEEKQAIPAKQEVDCAPSPKVKPKLKAVKRSVFAETLKDSTNKNFSEQLKTAQKRFKPPVRLTPKPLVGKEC
jgi:VCBS repeat-containing protein